MNDYANSAPLAALISVGLRNLWPQVSQQERYSYIRQGVSGGLDHILISPALGDRWDEYITMTPVHINADYPAVYDNASGTAYRSSDHDPLLTRFGVIDPAYVLFLPMLVR
jgi:predicted extracellular nuclease